MLTGRLSGGSLVTSRPRSSIRPEVGASKPPIIRRVVVLPQPDGPSKLKNSPSRTSRSMWSTATASPNFLTTSTSLTSTVGNAALLPGARDLLRHVVPVPAKDMVAQDGCQGNEAPRLRVGAGAIFVGFG